MTEKQCKPKTLLNAATCEIQYCSGCDMIHLSMGSMTLRIPTEHFKELAHDLGKGRLVLQGYKQESTEPQNSSTYTLHS